MEYQKNLLDNAVYQSSKFRTSNWVEINESMIVVSLDLKLQ